MRMSVNKGDPGHAAWIKHAGHKYIWEFMVGGELVEHVVTADTDEGIVVKHVTDANGKIRITPEGDAIMEEVLEGKVTITIKDGNGEVLWHYV